MDNILTLLQTEFEFCMVLDDPSLLTIVIYDVIWIESMR